MIGRALTILAVIVLLGAIAGVYLIRETPTALDGEENTVRTLVQDFGEQLERVSLLAPAQQLERDMESAYSPYVSAALVDEWLKNPAEAPGRLTSSPWPDRIEVSRVEQEGSGYTVEGAIVEVTNEGGGIGEAPTEAVRRPVLMTVSKEGDAWKITALTLGAYPGDATWIYSEPNAQGVQFQYPRTLPTRYISVPPEGWPPTVVLEAGDYSCAEEQQKMVGDREYCVVETTEGAAGSMYRTFEYITAQGDFIARVTFTLRFPQCANYGEEEQTACEAEQGSFDIDGLADRVTSSIRML